MDQLEALWIYQSAEIDLENMERALKNTETRKRLVRQQQLFKSNQTQLKKIEQKSVLTQSTLLEITSQVETLRKQMKEKEIEIAEIEGYDLEDLFPEDVHEMTKECESIKNALDSNKRKLTEILRTLENEEGVIQDTLVKMSRAKQAFDALKEQHAQELKAGKGDLEERRRVVQSAARDVPPELLSQYRQIKQHRSNPVAYLKNKRCQGCNIEVPSSVLQEIRANTHIVVCENCGRILLAAQEEPKETAKETKESKKETKESKRKSAKG